MTGSYKDLRVWQDGMKLAKHTYERTANFPRHELYGLANQMRRAAVSVPSNIAEGKGHRSDGEFGHFLFHARGSLLELETQVMLAGDLNYLSSESRQALLDETSQVARELNALINAVSPRSQTARAND